MKSSKKQLKVEAASIWLGFILILASCGGGGDNDFFKPPYCFLDISAESITLRVGETIGPWYPSLYCGGPDNPELPPVNFNWSSSNDGIVTAVDGLITGVAEGSAKVKVSTSYQGKTFSDSITVIVIAGCNKLPAYGQPPQISSNPNVAAIQNFNRLLMTSELTAEKLTPYVSKSYNYAGEDYHDFIENGLLKIIRQYEPDELTHCYARFYGFDPCSIGIEDEQITIDNEVAQNEIIIIKSGLWNGINISAPEHPLLSAIYRIPKRYDFIKENDGKWRFIAAKAISGEYAHIFGGEPDLTISANITPFEAVAINDEIQVAGEISGANRSAATLQPVSSGSGMSCYGAALNTGNVLNEMFGIVVEDGPDTIMPSDCLPMGVDHVRLNIVGAIEIKNQAEYKYASFIFKDYFLAVPEAPVCKDTVNLCLELGVVAQASSSHSIFVPERAIDGRLITSWFTETGDAANLGMAPYYEIILPQNAIVWKINMFGNRQNDVGHDFYSGKFEVFDENDSLLHDTGIVDLPAPYRDISLDLPNLNGVKRVRFTDTDDEGEEPGFSELEILGKFEE